MRNRLILLTGFALCMTFLFCMTEANAKDEAQPLPQQAIDSILDLESDDFQTRQQATQKLPEYGEQVIDPLLKVTEGDSLEAAVRAILVIEQIYIQGKEKSVGRAEDALEKLANAKNPSVAIRAEEVIDRHADIREKRAVREITKSPVPVPGNRDRSVISFWGKTGPAMKTSAVSALSNASGT